MLSVFAIYLWIVLKAGPKFMENRKPFNLTQITRLYNIYQIAACLFFITEAYKCGFSFREETWKCVHGPKYVGYLDELTMKISYYQWWSIFLRLSEFLETIFFIMRKKFNQVSILHVYHHISVPFFIWAFLMSSGGRMEAYIMVLNSTVHVIMYGYYFFSSFQKCQKYTNFAKPFITAIQILQLFIIFGHCIVGSLPGCHVTRLFIAQVINLGVLIFMFSKFYFENFLKGKRSSAVASTSKSQ